MGLFLKQTEQRTQLQSKIAADLANRLQSGQGGDGATEGVIMQSEDPAQAATGRSLFWVGVVTMMVVALVVFVLFVSETI